LYHELKFQLKLGIFGVYEVVTEFLSTITKIPKTGTIKTAPKGPATLKPIRIDSKTTIGCNLKALCISFGPMALEAICWIKRRIAKMATAKKGFSGWVISTTKKGGTIPKIGPTKGIMVKIPAASATEAAKSIEKSLKTIQVAMPAKMPKIT